MTFPFEKIKASYTWPQYHQLSQDLFDQGKTTSQDPHYNTAEILDYTKLNLARMHRVEKTTQLSPELQQALEAVQQPQHWVLLAESWCGDAAQIVPVIALAAAQRPQQISLQIILRDENLEIMDQFLTNGGRSIPKVIAVDAASQQVLGSWGPRPAGMQQRMQQWKAEGMPWQEMAQELHTWYAKDHTASTQHELALWLQHSTSQQQAQA